MTLEEDIRKHNKLVEEQFKKAEKGEIINLTDLMISQEKIIERQQGIKR